MGHGPFAFVAMFVDGWAGFSRLFIMVALVLTIVNAARFLARRRSLALAAANVAPPPEQSGSAPFIRGPYPSLWWPMVLLCVGFLVGQQFRSTMWIIAAGILVAAVVGLGLRALRVAHFRRGSAEVAPAALAVLLTTGVMLQFGLLMTIRLVVVPDPDTRVIAGLSREASDAAVRAVILPAIVLFIVVAALPALTRSRRNTRRRPTLPFQQGLEHPGRMHLLAIAAVFVLFAAPRLGDNLTIAGIATPEYGKVLYFVTLASMLAAYGYQFRMRTDRDRPLDMVRARRHLWYPIGIFAAVGLASWLKHDIGPLIPMFVGTVAVYVYLLGVQANRALEVTSARGRAKSRARRRVALRYARPFWVPVGVLAFIGAIVMLITPYISERGSVWADPWVYTWAAACEPPPPGVEVPQTPPGTQACQLSFAAAQASVRSQVSQSLAVIADGGVWGRGLQDTTSGRIPAGSTDFVLAVIWSKLGGLVVLLLAAVLALLAAALTRVGRQVPRADRPSDDAENEPGVALQPARLFVVGLTAMILGQFLFVLAATVNALPHSGITAPFLSRGGHSTVALGLGVIAALVVQYRGAARASVTPSPPGRQVLAPALRPATVRSWWSRPTVSSIAVVFLLCLTLVTGITLAPYNGLAENRPFCLTQRPRVVSTTCSTDRIAYDRTSVRISVSGSPQYERDRSGAKWVPIGTPMLSLTELSGLLQVNEDRGLVDQAMVDLIDGTSGTSFGARLSSPSTTPPTGMINLTVDPTVQQAAARALTADGDPALPPLAGGAVVLDAKTGRVLGAASAPGDSNPSTPSGTVDPEARRAFAKAHQFGIRTGGIIDESKKCADSDVDSALANCWRWSLEPAKVKESEDEERRRRHFVGDDPAVELPPTNVNRAAGRQYGLGSTFKVIVASAFLRKAGNTAATPIPAPATVMAGEQEIRNATKGVCPRATATPQGFMITLADALAVSCNTAFVRLALDLGWPVIRATAGDLGFVIGPAGDGHEGPAWVEPRLGKDSRVPADAEPSGIGNNVLGGGQVVGTPLQLATVMAAIANGGTLRQPLLVDSTVTARSGERVSISGASRTVFTPAQAAELRTALAGTTEPFGTARLLAAKDGRALYVKTGTHVLYTDGEAPQTMFTREIAWLTGFLDTTAGPVAFAIAVETRNEELGGARARWVAGQLIESIVRARG